MALGDANYSTNRSASKVQDPTVYSRIRIKNKDKLAIGFTFNKGLLKLEVSEEKDGFKYDSLEYINLSPTKAKLLKVQLESLLERMMSGDFIDPNEAVGVNSGMKDVKFIAFGVTGNRTDVPEHCFKLGKISGDGVIENVVEFVFNVDYDYSLHWSNVDKMEVDKVIDQFMGIKTIIDVLTEFINSSAGAIGASVWDTGRYELAGLKNRFEPLYDKLGVEKKTYNSNNGGGDNFFNRNASVNPGHNASSERKSYEDIEDMLG